MNHECDGSEWCCGGDASCDSWEDEPDCHDGEDHDWTSSGVWSLGGTTYQSRLRRRVLGRTMVSQGDLGAARRGAAVTELRRLRPRVATDSTLGPELPARDPAPAQPERGAP